MYCLPIMQTRVSETHRLLWGRQRGKKKFSEALYIPAALQIDLETRLDEVMVAVERTAPPADAAVPEAAAGNAGEEAAAPPPPPRKGFPVGGSGAGSDLNGL